MGRRPIRARRTRWAAALATWLARAGLAPNAISLAGLLAAVGAGGALLLSPTNSPAARAAALVAAAALVQVRLLANLLDGMVAIEGGRQTPTGVLFNEFPDRAADVILLVCAGYAAPTMAGSTTLGWAAAVLAVLTAYVRVVGSALGGPPQFCGPMAKSQRMALLTAACLLAAGQVAAGHRPWALPVALVAIVAGCVATLVRRIRRIAAELPHEAEGGARVSS
ncbi:MAG TPA: CDP-alcohol phosphatidyltransferase family protein [Methylomirabilota bacterium]|nr:CDP-alcohol phosphatidyltransferase family protein [Methylomirabilota bacterium]